MNQTKYVIVVGVDYSPASELALGEALSIASGKEHAHLHVVYVRPQPGSPSPHAETQVIAEDARQLELYVAQRVSEFETHHGKGPCERLFNHLRSGHAGHEIAQLAADVESDLVVVGTSDRSGIPRFLLGSVAEAVTRLAPCAVLVARPKAVPAPAPSIKPPCPRCVEVRRATNCAELWCQDHGERHHTSARPEPPAVPSVPNMSRE